MSRSPPEEVANAVTDGVGLVLSVVAAVVLLPFAWRGGGGWARCWLRYLLGQPSCRVCRFDAVSHALRRPKLKRFFTILDPAVIYLLIAGTYTPFGLMHLWHD